MTDPVRPVREPASPLAVASWVLYDFANSAFPTLVVTFVFATWFTAGVVGDDVTGTSIWGNVVALSGVLVALLSPIMGAVADRGGYKREFLIGTVVVCVLATAGLYWAGQPGYVWTASIVFVIANVAFEMGLVFYNAFLPDLNRPAQTGRISGYGYALGYVGGLLCLGLALVGFVMPEQPWLGLSTEAGQNVRATNLLVAGWFLVFALPQFLFVQETQRRTTPVGGNVVADSFAQLRDTFREVQEYRQVVRFLIARLLYNDGLVTVFAFGAIYAQGTFGFTTEEVLGFGVALNVSAGLGSFVMGFLDDRIGGKRTVMISIVGLLLCTLAAVVAPSKTAFWISSMVLGLFVGPNQSSSRSLMSRLVPESKENEFFGFFAFSGKATSFIGPLAMGWLTWAFATQRAGVLAVAGLLLAGLVALYYVDEDEGIAAAKAAPGG